MRQFDVRFVVFAGVFTALTILFTHVFAMQAVFVRIGFGFMPVALFAAMFGPWRGALMAGAADLAGCLIFTPGLFFPGFTLSASCAGFLYGHLFHRQAVTVLRAAAAFGAVALFIDLGMNTLWLTLLYHKAAGAFFLSRLLKCALLLPVQTLLFYTVYKSLSYCHLLYRPISK